MYSKILISLLSIFLLFSCNENYKVNTIYKINYDSGKTKSRLDKRLIEIEFDSIPSIADVEYITDSISDTTEDMNILINFCLPNEDVYENAVYASAHKKYGNSFYIAYAKRKAQPKPETNLSYEPKTKTPQANTKGMKNMGSWIETSNGLIVVLYLKGNTYYLHTMFPDGSDLLEKLNVRKRNGKNIYNVVGDDYEYMVIENSGLYIYDNDGNLGLVYKNYY